MNAVLSGDPPELAAPLPFLLRRVLETAPTFEDAVARLRDAPIASDALLLVTGTQRGEMAAVERSPTRAAVRTDGRPARRFARTGDLRVALPASLPA